MGAQQIKTFQRTLLERGWDLGPSRDDGDFGDKTLTAGLRAINGGKPDATPADPTPVSTETVPAAWMPDAQMARIIVHWTAGSHVASALDREHYHLLIEGDGDLVRGQHPVSSNAIGRKLLEGDYAAHTLSCNGGSIGVSLCCMAGAVEAPFKAGSYPMTRAQWDRLPHVLADLCRRYRIPVTAKTVLSHAEVEKTLGIKQRGKWDVARLAFDPSVIGATAVGDLMRKCTAALIEIA